jgi:hypothetical protein
MYISKEFFEHLIEHGEPNMIRELDKSLCGCNYAYHWKYNMQSGKFRPLINELDAELAQVHSTGQLYEFLIKKQEIRNNIKMGDIATMSGMPLIS